MLKPHAFRFAILLSLTLMQFATAGQLLYLASSQEKNITAYDLDDETGKLTMKLSVDLPGAAGPMAFSPNQDFVYAAVTGLENGKAGVATLKRSPDGSLKLVDTATISSRAPYIRTDKHGRNLLAAHYGTGDVTVYRIKDGVCTSDMLDHKVTERTAHCIEIDPSGQFVFVPHTAPNKVYQFRLNEDSGKLTPNDPPFATGPDEDHQYHQPRHFAHHPKLEVAYTSNERGGGITAWKFDSKKGTLTKLQTLSTLPPDYEGTSAAADINITPDGRFAYVSNRDTTKREKDQAGRDTLAGFSLDAKTGKMTLVGHFPTAAFPRSFCIDLTGRFVYAAGQRSATIVAYQIEETGALKQTDTYETGGTPIWVMCGEVK